MTGISEFTKIVRPNTLRPLSGAAPFTMIEFSLTNEVRDLLKMALEPFVKGHAKDNAKLAEIFSNPELFPKPVLDELRSMTKASGAEATAFVIRNLPEVDAHLIPEKLRPTELKNDLQRWLKANSYSNYVGEGLAGAAKLPAAEHEFVIARHAGDAGINGGGIHKHGHPFGTINVITTDGAPTRLLDMRTLFDEVEKENELGKIVVNVGSGNGPATLEQMPLWYLKHRDKIWSPADASLGFEPIADHANTFEKAAARHSHDIVGNKGDMAIWPDNGLVFHQAIAKDSAVDKGALLRAITVRALGKQAPVPSR